MRCCSSYLTAAMMRSAAEPRRSAAIAQRPMGPPPITTAVSPSLASARSAAWTALAAGSTMTAASSLRSSGTSWSWLSWATRAADQPPPVRLQAPVCSPAPSGPVARCP